MIVEAREREQTNRHAETLVNGRYGKKNAISVLNAGHNRTMEKSIELQ